MEYGTKSQHYIGSNVDNYLENTVYNNFYDSIRNALVGVHIQDSSLAEYQGTRHVVAPAKIEVCNNYGNIPGSYTMYPIFSPAGNPNPKCIFKNPNGNKAGYWTRSIDTYHSDQVNYVSGDGYGSTVSIYSGNKFYVVARLRFAKS